LTRALVLGTRGRQVESDMGYKTHDDEGETPLYINSKRP